MKYLFWSAVFLFNTSLLVIILFGNRVRFGSVYQVAFTLENTKPV